MNFANQQLISEGLATGILAINSEPIRLTSMRIWSFQINYLRTTGTLKGTYKVQVSNQFISSGDTVTEWADLDGAIWTINTATYGTDYREFKDIGYIHARIVYVNQGGTGTINISALAKG